jgi:hypothetical protein
MVEVANKIGKELAKLLILPLPFLRYPPFVDSPHFVLESVARL